jgi:hypothetical protein
VIRPFVDQNDIMPVAQLASQMGRGDHPAAPAAEDHYLLSPVESEHFALPYFTGSDFLA